MKHFAIICASLVLFQPRWAASQPAPSTSEGWTRLFNGKNLDGWKPYGDEKWVAENGTILGESAAKKYGYLVTDLIYRAEDQATRGALTPKQALEELEHVLGEALLLPPHDLIEGIQTRMVVAAAGIFFEVIPGDLIARPQILHHGGWIERIRNDPPVNGTDPVFLACEPAEQEMVCENPHVSTHAGIEISDRAALQHGFP